MNKYQLGWLNMLANNLGLANDKIFYVNENNNAKDVRLEEAQVIITLVISNIRDMIDRIHNENDDIRSFLADNGSIDD